MPSGDGMQDVDLVAGLDAFAEAVAVGDERVVEEDVDVLLQ